MGGKKGPQIAFTKLAPDQPCIVCLTLRDRFGSAIPKMSLTAKQAGTELKAPDGSKLVTDDTGRCDIGGVRVGQKLELTLDSSYLPADGEDTRSTQYVYTVDEITDVVEFEVDDDPDGKVTSVDQKRAYVTAFCVVNPFNPKFRFPWQNPIHRNEAQDGESRIYANRVKSLRNMFVSLFGLKSADVASLAHDDLVKKLVDMYVTTKAALDAPPTPPPPAPEDHTNLGTDGDPPPPPAPPPPDPLPDPPPDQKTPVEQPRPIAVKDATPKPDPVPVPPPKPPAKVPAADVDGPNLPRWVWYMLFHYCGLRYTPQKADGKGGMTDVHRSGAHGSYIAPSAFLRRMRVAEINDRFGEKAAAPDVKDLTEGLLLASRAKGKDAAIKAAILAGDPAKEKKALVTLFTDLAKAEKSRLDGFFPKDLFLDGDYFALGLLKAKRLKKHPTLTDDFWKIVVSRTQLRNDVQADGWEIKETSPSALTDFFKPEAVDITEWRSGRLRTKDTLMPSAVCDQQSESAELVRSGNVGKWINGNAKQAAGVQQLIYLTGANGPSLHRGMHCFFSGFSEAKPGEENCVPDDISVEIGFYVNRGKDDPKEATPLSKIPLVNLDDLLDKTSPINQQIDAKNAGKPADKQEVKLVTIQFVGCRRIPADQIKNKASGNVFVRCELMSVDEVVVDKPGPPPTFKKTGKKVQVPKLVSLKYTHQECIVDVKHSAAATSVRNMSTAANMNPPGGGYAAGSGIKVYDLGKDNKVNMNVFCGFMAQDTNEKTDLLDAVFLNPAVLKKT